MKPILNVHKPECVAHGNLIRVNFHSITLVQVQTKKKI